MHLDGEAVHALHCCQCNPIVHSCPVMHAAAQQRLLTPDTIQFAAQRRTSSHAFFLLRT